MPCDSRIPLGMTRPQRRKQVDVAVAALKAQLAAKAVTVKVSPQGAIAFVGAWQRQGVSDVCAYRKLAAEGSSELRQAIAQAEVRAGRKIDPQQIAAGVHSHDSGQTWDKGH